MSAASSKNGPPSVAAFVLSLAVLSSCVITLLYNRGFSAMVTLSNMTWEVYAIVLGGCGLVVVVTLIEKDWRPFLSHLSAIIFIPTALGFSNADWLTGLGFPASIEVFRSDLPDLACLAVGLAVIGSFLLGRDADRLEGVRENLLAHGASVKETDRAVWKAFQRMLRLVLASIIALALIWTIAAFFSDRGQLPTAWSDGGIVLVGLLCVALLVLLYLYLARRGEAPIRTPTPAEVPSNKEGTGGSGSK
jgi:peptidoglycan biosynthesis protein MviN/MurJ (putative lipid II flippase)